MPYSGAGNTFFIFDNRDRAFDMSKVALCCANWDVDGVILAEESSQADAQMRIFNRDGSEAEMCGNGLRCFIHFLNSLGMERSIYHIETLAGIQKGWIRETQVFVAHPPPKKNQLHYHKDIHFLNTGVPHAVLFVDDIESVPVESRGQKLRFSPLFTPEGANVNFVEIKDGALFIRTYERGVEAETLACGTGAVACAIAAHNLYELASPIEVQVRSKEKLKIAFDSDLSEVIVQGPVNILHERKEQILNNS